MQVYRREDLACCLGMQLEISFSKDVDWVVSQATSWHDISGPGAHPFETAQYSGWITLSKSPKRGTFPIIFGI
jgi:hypothetical protein